MDSVRLRVEEILGDAFVEAYGLDLRDEGDPPDPDLEPEEDDEE